MCSGLIKTSEELVNSSHLTDTYGDYQIYKIYWYNVQITLLLATVILTLIVKETSHRVFGFIFKKKITRKPNQILNDLQGSGNCEDKAILWRCR